MGVKWQSQYSHLRSAAVSDSSDKPNVEIQLKELITMEKYSMSVGSFFVLYLML